MKIVELSAIDIERITKLYQEDFADGWTAEMLASAFNGGRFFTFGIEIDNSLVAVITFTKGYDDADIEGIVVAKSFRGKGFAKRLVSVAEERLKADGKKRILLEVREGNIPATSLYESAGFKNISVRKKYYSDGENALVMEKVIL